MRINEVNAASILPHRGFHAITPEQQAHPEGLNPRDRALVERAQTAQQDLNALRDYARTCNERDDRGRLHCSHVDVPIGGQAVHVVSLRAIPGEDGGLNELTATFQNESGRGFRRVEMLRAGGVEEVHHGIFTGRGGEPDLTCYAMPNGVLYVG